MRVVGIVLTYLTFCIIKFLASFSKFYQYISTNVRYNRVLRSVNQTFTLRLGQEKSSVGRKCLFLDKLSDTPRVRAHVMFNNSLLIILRKYLMLVSHEGTTITHRSRLVSVLSASVFDRNTAILTALADCDDNSFFFLYYRFPGHFQPAFNILRDYSVEFSKRS